ncbi:MAG: ABC transporter permease [Anaerolineales bacterium]|jgi:ABC-type Na+ efflux pump permease subunit
MNPTKVSWTETLYNIWIVGSKDIVDALKSKATRNSMIVVVALLAFFYWSLSVRPFDKRVDAVVVPENGSSTFENTIDLGDGALIRFFPVSSVEEMQRSMGYRNLGLVVPEGFDAALEAGEEPVLTGYVNWFQRAKAADLEEIYSDLFSRALGQPVRVAIQGNSIIPRVNTLGNESTVAFHLVFITFFMVISIVPFLMLEERTTKTMEALLVSPLSATEIVLGKALAGVFYALVIGTAWFLFNGMYVVNWGMALLAFLFIALFSLAVSLVMGSIINDRRQLNLYNLPVTILLIVPAFFAQEPNLVPGVRAYLEWLPTTALSRLMNASLSLGVTGGMLLKDLAISLGFTAIIFAFVVWLIRRSDR